MTEESSQPEPDFKLPKARVARRWTFTWFWIVPALALAFVGWLAFKTWIAKGPTITVTFDDAQGIEAGKSEVKFRGAKVGDVTKVSLSKDLQSVRIKIELDQSAEEIARAQSQFWLVEPQISAAQITGLRTIVSGSYIEVKPGKGARTNEFTGLSEAPALAYHRGGLELVLLREQLGSIQKRTPIFYRGVQVGEVTDFELSTNALTVEIHAHIDEAYAPLVRQNTRFWNAGGIHFNFGLLGADIRAKSFETLFSGGIAFNTPPNTGASVRDGALFRLYDKPQDEWEKWAAPIHISPSNSSRSTSARDEANRERPR
jgi:paraquat-inducible protein B